jgi:oligopeptide/dipeptide ABC transporter ATP-binding protein
VLLADEPTTSLDVTIQASFLKLLKHLQRENDSAILFVTHDFGIVRQLCDRVAVMYAGKIVESAPTESLLHRPAHPYTKALLQSVPSMSGRVTRLPTIPGQPPSVYEEHHGCPFAPRCESAMPSCSVGFPRTTTIDPNHEVACRLYE